MKIENKIWIFLCGTILIFSIFIWLRSFPFDNSQGITVVPQSSIFIQENATLHFIYHPGCSICVEAHEQVVEFLANHPEILYVPYDVSNTTEEVAAKQFLNTEYLSWPSVVIEIDPCKYFINGQFITSDNLESIYSHLINNPQSCEEWTYYREYKMWIPIVTGLLSGLSPCIILITGVFGTSIVANQSKKYFLFGLVGFSLGVLLMYFIIGFVFIYFMDFASIILSGLALKLILGIPLILLGLWQCIDAWNENSRLFRTPDKLKKFFKELTEENSLVSSFLLGSAFTLLKSPCIAGILLSLLFSINQVGLFSVGKVVTALLLFSLGVLIPIITVFGILRIGISNDKINALRVKTRPYLRLLSGLVIIATTIVAFF